MCPHQEPATQKHLIQGIISAYGEDCFHQVKFDSVKKQSGAEPRSAKARAPHLRSEGSAVPGKGAPRGSDLCRGCDWSTNPGRARSRRSVSAPARARGGQHRAQTTRVSAWSEINSPGSSQAPNKLDLDSSRLQISDF